MKRYYLAYGSNLNVEQMAVRCPSAKAVGTAEIKNYGLLFKGSKTGAYLTIEPKKGGKVPAAVWEVDAKDELSLDRYEGFPNFYYKGEIEIPVTFLKSGKTAVRTVFVYIMHETRQHGVPTGFYVRTCLDGYRDFGFDEKILINAINESVGLCNEKF